MLTCCICGGPSTGPLMCAACGRSWDRARTRDDGSIGAAMAWAAKRARRFERLRVRGEINAQGHRWQPVGGAMGASYARCERCGLLLAAVVDLSAGYTVLRLCGVDDGSGVGLIGRGEKMPQCPAAVQP